MESQEFEARVDRIKRRAHGQWTPVLTALGVPEEVLSRKNQPCPMCGGTDRFQYTDRFGESNYHCRGCGAGGGLKLAQACLGVTFTELLERLARALVPSQRSSVVLRHVALAPAEDVAQLLRRRAMVRVGGNDIELHRLGHLALAL